MGSYVPSTGAQREAMLRAVGVSSTRELFRDVPEQMLLTEPLHIPAGMSELEVSRAMTAMASENRVYGTVLRGAGAYDHYIPSIVKYIPAKEEFLTAYTPYQAEMSQGLLQSIFEYQTMICELTGMDVSNASVYDGATAAAEAAENALRQLAETGAVPAAWAAEALDTAETGESYTDWDGKYYSLDATYCVTDSLGFVTVRRFGMTDNALFTRYSVTMDSRTGTVVEAWLSMAGTDAENTPLPTETALRSFAAQAGLESLGDWAAPADSPYGCALYSTNGGALITASTHPYTYQDYVGTAPVSSDRWYYSLTLQLRTEDQLPG